jgi:hypothetical protein
MEINDYKLEIVVGWMVFNDSIGIMTQRGCALL